MKIFFQDKDIMNYILSKGGITLVFRMIAMILSFFSMWVITNFYGESVFGLYSIALTILQISVMIFGLGIPIAFVSFTGAFINESKVKGFFIKTLKIVLLSALIPTLIYLVFADFVANYIFNKGSLKIYFQILSLTIPFMISHEIICYYFMSIKKFITYGIFIFILPNVLFIALLIIFHFYDFELHYSFLAYAISILITSLIGFLAILLNKTSIEYPLISAKVVLNKSLPMMLSGVFLLLLNWTDVLMLARFETESQIGIYNVAFKVGYLTLFFVVSMNVIIMPKVSELFHKSYFHEMKRVVNKATQVIILLTIPLAAILIFFSKYILSFFGEAFISGSTVLILITVGGLFNALTGNVDQILNMTDNQKLVRNIFIIGFIINVILNLILIPNYGILGAAVSSLVTNIFINSIFVLVIKKKLGFYTFK
jgi:O-antigen/teichoic acid export membrane protein